MTGISRPSPMLAAQTLEVEVAVHLDLPARAARRGRKARRALGVRLVRRVQVVLPARPDHRELEAAAEVLAAMMATTDMATAPVTMIQVIPARAARASPNNGQLSDA